MGCLLSVLCQTLHVNGTLTYNLDAHTGLAIALLQLYQSEIQGSKAEVITVISPGNTTEGQKNCKLPGT